MFSVVIKESALDAKVKAIGREVLEEENPKELKQFREVALKNVSKIWEDKKDIKIAIHETLSEFSYRKDLVGWIKGDNAVNVGSLAEEIARLTKENSELRLSLNSIRQDSNSTYSSLTFQQLKNLLEKQIISDEKKQMTLYSYLIQNGWDLTSGKIASNDRVALTALEACKIVKWKFSDDLIIYKFTDEGHNFFLKAFAMIVESDSNVLLK